MTSVTRSELTGDYVLDPAHTQIGFVARHAMVTKVRGAFNKFEGTAHLDGENPANSTVRVSIQADSIDTRNEQRDGHLRTNDFLDAPNHPQITFVSTSVRQVENDRYEVTGDLTIKGVSKSLTIPFEFQGAVMDPMNNFRVGLEGSVTINRKEFGLTWNAALEGGGVLVGEKVVLEFEISAVRQSS
ncbi:YceI family protein [Streptacidiphilus fuscans]|uniref:Polyisoprenoid-binding protein n=1 Tax=Streptacidiphilus fuscans TaxID=2789292 RepID=A0A931FH68_9ACTN|nr:YceI family protein [Streptacidiphilus fuscans]MBF9072050.1 polyisoprenoid-binding protein [Streptacidiphilus fuscans]